MNDTLIKKIQDLVISEFGKVYQEYDEIVAKIDDSKAELSAVTNKLDTAKSTLETTEAQIQKLNADAQKQTKDLNAREEYVKSEEARLLNLKEVVGTEVESARKQIIEMGQEISRLNDERRARQEAEMLATDKRVKEIKAELELRLPELNRREKELNQKEADIEIVVARWKKLFGEKGLNFKI